MTMTKNELIKCIGQRLGCSQDRSAEMVNAAIDCIKGCLQNGDGVLISGFGKFCVKDKAARQGRNPATGEDLMIEPRKVVTFKSSCNLRDKINKKR